MSHPSRILIAGDASGSGKSVITCALLQALQMRGLTAAAFKCGPDYIDPMFHRRVLGTPGGNLDMFFTGSETLRSLFLQRSAGCDIAVIEGVMGYYDGIAASDEGSTFAIARQLRAPTVLVINSRGQSRSALATLRGFLAFRPQSGIAGVIFNQMSAPVYAALRQDVLALGVTPLGHVPRQPDFVIESRHLGLVSPDEVPWWRETLSRLASQLEQTVDVDALLRLAGAAPTLSAAAPALPPSVGPVRVAVARDEAFSFLYAENLQLLEHLGARITFFSPLRDRRLPPGTQGLILCGGYPELHAAALSLNDAMRRAVRQAVQQGMPCLAECGGFLYLHEQLEDLQGRRFAMAGALRGLAHPSKRREHFGYLTLRAAGPSPYLPPGEGVRGHEFHRYGSTDEGRDMTAFKPSGDQSWPCMHARGALLCGFPHLFYYSNPAFVRRFLTLCAKEANPWPNPS